MKWILILITLLFATQQANASFYIGRDLQAQIEKCDSRSRIGSDALVSVSVACGRRAGYVAGVFDAYYRTARQKDCTPDTVTLGQLQAVVEKYLNNHPEDWHFSANSLILNAVNEAWPCPD